MTACQPFPDGKLCSSMDCTYLGADSIHSCKELGRSVTRWRSPTWQSRVESHLDGWQNKPVTVEDLRKEWDRLGQQGAIDPDDIGGWHHALAHLRYKYAKAAGASVWFGRCRSGKRWFWFAAAFSWDRDGIHCTAPVCGYGWAAHEHGWADSEQAAITSLSGAVICYGGVDPRLNKAPDAFARGAGEAAAALKRINEAKRKARPSSGSTDTGMVEYLYSPEWWFDDSESQTVRRLNTIAITKKTAKRIYFDASDRWDRSAGLLTLGYIGRAELETDTRCPGGGPGKCEHERYSSHGYPPGEMRYHGSARGAGHLFATREAAEEYLFGAERERERQRPELEADVKRLRREMADAHPDRGGTNEEFMAARERYEKALRRAS